MPRKGPTVRFYDGQNQFRIPFMMYANIEALLEPIQERVPGDPNESYTTKVNQHIPSGWCIYSKFAYGDIDDPLKLYRGRIALRSFASTSGRKLAGCTICFLKNPWIL